MAPPSPAVSIDPRPVTGHGPPAVPVAGDQPRWILVVGTGVGELSNDEQIAAHAVGKALADAGYGLVSGGWEGVDFEVTREFALAVQRARVPVHKRLKQVVAHDAKPGLRYGKIVRVAEGADDTEASVAEADAVVLIGGKGGTYGTYVAACQVKKPVFALAMTEGDAARVYDTVLGRWPAGVFGPVTADDYHLLSEPIGEDGAVVAGYLLELIERSLSARGPSSAAVPPAEPVTSS